MNWIDLIAVYWFGIKILLYLAGLIILFSSLDDLFIDIVYWCKKLTDKLTGNRGTSRTEAELNAVEQLPVAIMVPAWQEAAVIGKMAELAARRFEYSNFHVFVGTYPNDSATQAEVDKVAEIYPHIHKVICAEPGPTTKADCVNNIIEHIFRFELTHDIKFACFVFHDSEDVVHSQELKVYNYWVKTHDLIQLPVIPLLRPWWWFTAGHYNDEFGEYHSKDMVVRQALSGNVPSAGVGTGFSRKAILSLAKTKKGLVFNTGSLTEDYDISIQLHSRGYKQVYVQQQVPTKSFWRRDYVAVRAYFPHAFHLAVRQKSRWIVGIVFQSWRNLGWEGSLALRYILYRDRKAVMTNPVNFIAYFVALNIVSMTTIHFIWEGAISFPSLIYDDSWLMGIMSLNGLLLLNRFVERYIFISRLFGPVQGLLAIPRMFWANVINFLAFIRALGQNNSAQKQGKEVAWDKTTHDFPELDDIQ